MVLAPLWSAPQSLQKGQIIKQFFTYSIAESLSRGASPLGTSLPCEPKRIFAEEPPVFHILAHVWLPLGPRFAFVFPYLIFLVTAALLLMFVKTLVPHRDSWEFSAWILATPILQRYAVQFLPDTLSACLLLAAVVICLRSTRSHWLVFLATATATKFLAVFAALPLWIFHCWKTRRSIVFIAAGTVLLVAPFLLWVAALNHYQIPNPFHFTNMIENRHSGTLGALLDPKYWAKIGFWVCVKGIGLPLTCIAIFALFRRLREQSPVKIGRNDRILKAWLMAAIPYWLLVRQGNFVHDYYFLVFAVPFATMALSLFYTDRGFSQLRWAHITLFLVHAALGIQSGWSMKPVWVEPPLERPFFCNYESVQNIQKP